MASDDTKDHDETEERPAECLMLDILDKDIEAGLLVPFPQSLLERIDALVGDMDIDLDQPLGDDDDDDVCLYDPLADLLEAERSTKH